MKIIVSFKGTQEPLVLLEATEKDVEEIKWGAENTTTVTVPDRGWAPNQDPDTWPRVTVNGRNVNSVRVSER